MNHPDVHPLTDADLDTSLAQEATMLVEFGATWCPPCRAMEPHLAALAERWRGRARVAACNIDDNPQAAIRFQVMSAPTFVLLRRGVEVERVIGAVPRARLEAALERAVG